MNTRSSLDLLQKVPCHHLLQLLPPQLVEGKQRMHAALLTPDQKISGFLTTNSPEPTFIGTIPSHFNSTRSSLDVLQKAPCYRLLQFLPPQLVERQQRMHAALLTPHQTTVGFLTTNR